MTQVSVLRRMAVPALLLSTFLLIPLPGTALAQGASDQDAAEISAYALSVAGLEKYRQATTNLAQLGEALLQTCDEDQDDQSLDAMVAEIRRIPGAAEALESAGMPVREYVVLSWAMFSAGFAAWGLDQPGGELPPGVSMANVEFYRAHETEFQEAASLMEAYECDENGDDGDDEEAPDEYGYEE
jgi:hypothetical protein